MKKFDEIHKSHEFLINEKDSLIISIKEKENILIQIDKSYELSLNEKDSLIKSIKENEGIYFLI